MKTKIIIKNDFKNHGSVNILTERLNMKNVTEK